MGWLRDRTFGERPRASRIVQAPPLDEHFKGDRLTNGWHSDRTGPDARTERSVRKRRRFMTVLSKFSR